MLGIKKRNDIQMIGNKKRNAMIIGMKHKANQPMPTSSPTQDVSVGQQKSVLEKMTKTGQNMGMYS